MCAFAYFIFLFLGLRFTNDNGVCLGDSDVTINSGKKGRGEASSDDSDSMSGVPDAFREPLKQQVKRKLSESKSASVRKKQIEHRQVIQAVTRILCSLIYHGFAEIISLDWFEQFIKNKINTHVLHESLTSTVGVLETSGILLMFSLAGTHIDYIINHFKYAMDIWWQCAKAEYTDRSLFKTYQQNETSHPNGYKRDIDFVVKFAEAFSNGKMIARWRHFNIHVPDWDFSFHQAWNSLGKQRESIGWWSLIYWCIHTFLEFEICSRVKTGVSKGRSTHSAREFIVDSGIHDFFEEAYIDDGGFLSKLVLDTAKSGYQNNKHFDKNILGFDETPDIFVQLEHLVPDVKLQYQFTQHKIAIQLLLDSLLPLMVYLLPKRMCFDHRNMGGAARDIKACMDSWMKLFYWKKAHQMDFPKNSPAKPGKGVAESMGTVQATPDEKIIHVQEQAWSITVASWANRNVSGCKQLQASIRQCVDNGITIQPVSAAPVTFSKYHIDRCLNSLLADKNKGGDGKIIRQNALDANSNAHTDGFHRDHSPEHDARINSLLSMLNMNFSDETALKIYDASFYHQQFWKHQEIRKSAWKDKKSDYIKNAVFTNGVLYYGIGWEYQFDSQHTYCKSDDFKHCIAVFKKYHIDCPESLHSVTGPGTDLRLHGMTSSDTDANETNLEDDGNSLDGCASVSVDVSHEDDDCVVTEAIADLKLDVSEEDDNSNLSQFSESEESDHMDVMDLMKVKQELQQQVQNESPEKHVAKGRGSRERHEEKHVKKAAAKSNGKHVDNGVGKGRGSRERHEEKHVKKAAAKRHNDKHVGKAVAKRKSEPKRERRARCHVKKSKKAPRDNDSEDEPRISGIGGLGAVQLNNNELKTNSAFNSDKFEKTKSYLNLSMAPNSQNDDTNGQKRSLNLNYEPEAKRRRKNCDRPSIQISQAKPARKKRERRRRRKNIKNFK